MLADSLGDYLRAQWRRIKSGESGALPVVAGLIIIIIFFQAERSKFGSATNLVNLFEQASIYILLGAAQIFALILSEIDLSVGFVLAVGGMVIAELIAPPVNFPWWLGIICGARRDRGNRLPPGEPDHEAPHSVVRRHARRPAVLRRGPDRARHDRQAGGRRRDLGHRPRALSSSWSTPTSASRLGWIMLGGGARDITPSYRYAAPRAAAQQGLDCASAQRSPCFQIGAAAVGGDPARLRMQHQPRPTDPAGRGPVRDSVRRARAARGTPSSCGRTRLGRYMYAIGGNPEAARRAGINVQRVRRLGVRVQRDDRRARRAGLRVHPGVGVDRHRRRARTRCTRWRRP